MVYGFTYEEMAVVKRPEAVKKLWGHYLPITVGPEYSLTRFYLKKGGAQPLHHYLKTGGTLYVEEGAALLRIIGSNNDLHVSKLDEKNVFRVKPGLVHALCGLDDSYVYLFSGRNDGGDYREIETEEEAAGSAPDLLKMKISPAREKFKIEKPFDYRDKYWGSIQSLVNEEYAGKRIYIKAGSQNSLEFHCRKTETYFVHSGKLKVGLRLGRGENRSVVIAAGDIFEIPPGLMHMKIGIEDSVVIEISTHDDDRDSHIVEDGKTYKHKEL